MKKYMVKAQVLTGIDDSVVWQGEFQVEATDRMKARQAGRDWIELRVPQHDPRIDPRIQIEKVRLLV